MFQNNNLNNDISNNDAEMYKKNNLSFLQNTEKPSTLPLTNLNAKRNREVADISDECLSPLKRLKISSNVEREDKLLNMQSKETRSKKGFNFLTACQQVSTEEYHDVSERLGLCNVPDCCHYTPCLKHNEAHTPFQVLPYEQQAFRIDFKAGMWCEALDVFRAIIKYNKYPNVDIVLDVLKMIIYIDDGASGFTSQYIIKRCQNVLRFLFSVHPPCSEILRTFYKEFLNSSLNIFEKSSLYDDVYDAKHGLLKYIIDVIQLEIQNNNQCGEDTEKTSDERNGENNSDNLAPFEKLERSIRILRLVLILDVMVDLLERDLAIWITKHIHNPRKYMVRKQKPFIAWLLWQNSVIHTGLVNNISRQVFKMFIALIELKYPTSHIKVFARLLSLIFQTYYLCGNVSNDYYPDIRKHCSALSSELFTLIRQKNVNLILKIINNIQQKQLQFLISKSLLQMVLKSSESNFIVMVQNIFKYRLWNNSEDDLRKNSCLDMTIGSKNMFIERLRTHGLKYFYINLMNKDYLEANTTIEFNKNEILQIAYFAFKYFLCTFNIVKIQTSYGALCTRDKKNNDIYEPNDTVAIESANVKNCIESDRSIPQNMVTPFPLNEECYKDYRLIFTILKNISLYHSEIKGEYPNVYKLFQSLQVFDG